MPIGPDRVSFVDPGGQPRGQQNAWIGRVELGWRSPGHSEFPPGAGQGHTP